MEIANAFVDMKRYPKGSEFDNGGIGDLFGIDDLLDFSSEEIGAPAGEGAGQVQGSSPVTAAIRETVSSSRPSLMPGLFGPNGAGDICVPCEDIAQLEWLSNFVEESFSSADATLMVSHSQHIDSIVVKGAQRNGGSSPVSVLEGRNCVAMTLDQSFNPEIMVHGRARRSKRSRNGVCFWNTRILSAYDGSSASILESSSASSTPAAAPLSLESLNGLSENGGADSWAMAKKAKSGSNGMGKRGQEAGGSPVRKCLHCGIQRTPQWRAGPMGPKTLCNACGVRYKSGRLLPEYRPAASPTFVDSVHSNSHKRVLELRKQRELAQIQELLINTGS